MEKVKIEDERYPRILKEIDNPPGELYYKGTPLAPHQPAPGFASREAGDSFIGLVSEKCLAVVGTRRASDYGKEIAFRFSKALSQAGLTVVSGMARGIDTMAHRGALEGGRRTIAVLGTGLEEKVIYPQENLKLARQIVERGGCLISEYPPFYPGGKHNFLRRNRLISGLSLGVLVVEAKLKSGALNTASWAKKQGKKVFVIPGSIYSSSSRGCHLLIKQGATLVEKPADILKELKIAPLDFTSVSPRDSSSRESPASQAEQLILKALRNGSLAVDKIIEKTELSASQTASCLSLLEIQSKVKNLGGSVYALA